MCVVFSHVLRGLLTSKMLAPSEGELFVDNWLYTFQVPVFFFVAGAFVNRVKARETPREFMQDALLRLGYPYAVWQTLQILIMLAASGVTNRAVQARDLLKFPVEPMFQFWFLYVLMLILVLYAALRSSRVSDGIAFWFFASMLFWPDVEWLTLRELRTNAVFFGCGLVAPGLLKQMSGWSAAVLLLFGSACFAGMTLLVAAGLAYPTAAHPVGAMLGVLGTVAFAMLLDRCPNLPGLEFVGKFSLEIYLAHVCFTAAVRILLARVLHVYDTGVQIALALVAGVLGPCLLGTVASRYRIPIFRLKLWPPAKRPAHELVHGSETVQPHDTILRAAGEAPALETAAPTESSM